MHLTAVVALVAALAVPTAALAQATATPPASPPPAANAPKPDCQRPDEYPGKLASDQRRLAWQKSANAYIACMKKFVEEQKALGDLHYDAARTAITTVNKDAADFNAAAKE